MAKAFPSRNCSATRNTSFLDLIGARRKVAAAEFSAEPVEFYPRKARWRMAVPRSLYRTGNGTVCRRRHRESGDGVLNVVTRRYLRHRRRGHGNPPATKFDRL